MESVAVIVLARNTFVPVGDYDYIGVDRGAFNIINAGLKCTFCIGDFDSCTSQELESIKENCADVIELNAEKNDTDSEAAVKECLERGYDEIWLINAFGGRVDHSVINLRLAYKYPLKVFIVDDNNRVFALNDGNYEIVKGKYDYLSIFAEDEAIVTLAGVKYPLNDIKLTSRDLYTVSNEILEDAANISVKEGRVLIIQSSDKKE